MSLQATPIILLAGQAGSGKDTVAAYIAKHYNAAVVAQADPMKRFAADVFGFTEQQLWGPSEFRNAVDPGTLDRKDEILKRFYIQAEYSEIMTKIVPSNAQRPFRLMEVWFHQMIDKLEAGEALSPRLVLQTLGTEFGRAVSLNMWSLYAIETCKQLLFGGHEYERRQGLTTAPGRVFGFSIISDIRFLNEIINGRVIGGLPVLIDRPSVDKTVVEAAGVKGHASEAELGGIPKHFYSKVIKNTGTLDELYVNTRQMMHETFNVVPRNQ